MKIALDEGAFLPSRGHTTDAGMDLLTPKGLLVMPNSSVVVDTGVHVELPPNTVGMLKSKSGLNVKNGIQSEGVLDEGYTGSIVAKLYNHGDKPVVFERGDKITQLVILPVIIPDILEIVDSLEETERGDNGFGSTGK